MEAFDEIDTALALDIQDDEVEPLISWTDELLGDRSEAVDRVLGAVVVLLPVTFAADARAIWRTWMATTDNVVSINEPRALPDAIAEPSSPASSPWPPGCSGAPPCSCWWPAPPAS